MGVGHDTKFFPSGATESLPAVEGCSQVVSETGGRELSEKDQKSEKKAVQQHALRVNTLGL